MLPNLVPSTCLGFVLVSTKFQGINFSGHFHLNQRVHLTIWLLNDLNTSKATIKCVSIQLNVATRAGNIRLLHTLYTTNRVNGLSNRGGNVVVPLKVSVQ